MTQPLTFEVTPEEQDDLRSRIRATRWPDDVGDDWERGTRPSTLRHVLERWAEHDWADVEQVMRDETHLLVPRADGRRLHVWRSGPVDAPTVVLLHGWPDSHVRYRDVVPLLADDLDVVVPSLPGFGFSDPQPRDAGGPRWAAEQVLSALDGLGVRELGVYGGDLGTGLAEQLALIAPDRVTGLNLADVPIWRTKDDPDLTTEEEAWVEGARRWWSAEGGYSHVHRTKPQTLAASLTDSPAGLASWILEKFRAWGDHDVDVLDRVPVDRFVENLSIYWYTRTAGSAARCYLDWHRHPAAGDRVTVRTGFGQFPHDIDDGPESFARRWYPVDRFTRFERGGHFGALEEPAALAADLRAFFLGEG